MNFSTGDAIKGKAGKIELKIGDGDSGRGTDLVLAAGNTVDKNQGGSTYVRSGISPTSSGELFSTASISESKVFPNIVAYGSNI